MAQVSLEPGAWRDSEDPSRVGGGRWKFRKDLLVPSQPLTTAPSLPDGSFLPLHHRAAHMHPALVGSLLKYFLSNTQPPSQEHGGWPLFTTLFSTIHWPLSWTPCSSLSGPALCPKGLPKQAPQFLPVPCFQGPLHGHQRHGSRYSQAGLPLASTLPPFSAERREFHLHTSLPSPASPRVTSGPAAAM